MNGEDRLLTQASAMVRASCPLDPRVVAREVAEIDTAELARCPQDRAHLLFAVRSAVLGYGLADADVRVRIAEGIRGLVKAARATPQTIRSQTPPIGGVSSHRAEPRRYWVDR